MITHTRVSIVMRPQKSKDVINGFHFTKALGCRIKSWNCCNFVFLQIMLTEIYMVISSSICASERHCHCLSSTNLDRRCRIGVNQHHVSPRSWLLCYCFLHSLNCRGDIGALAQRFARTPFLVHHLGRVTARPSDTEGLRALLQLASIPNVYIKLSGFGFAQEDGWDFPCTSSLELVRAIYANFDADRLCWGSDYPVSQRYMTYRQSLEIVRTHCSFISGNDMQKVLGGNMKALLERGR